MIPKGEVERIAKLARLGLTEVEIKKFQKDLSLILDYFNLLKKVDASKIKETSHPFEIENRMREDQVDEKLKMTNEKLMELAPETEKGYLKVKSIL